MTQDGGIVVNERIIKMNKKQKWKVEKRNKNYNRYAGYKVTTKINTKSGKGGYKVIANITDSSDAKENAQLIATAPELLDLAKDFKKYLDENLGCDQLNQAMYEKIEKIISKVEG